MEKIVIAKDNGAEIFKIKGIKPDLHLFNSNDVLLGNPMSNVAIAFVYNWKTDEPPKDIQNIFTKISNYSFLTGYWRTTNGAKYVFSNILQNPNVNKLVVCIFNDKDNGHLLVDALRNFWKNGTTKIGVIVNSKAANPRFEGLEKNALERIRKQVDLIIIEKATDEIIEKVINQCIQEPENKASIPGIEVIPDTKLYDNGARYENPYHAELTTLSGNIEDIPESEIISTLGLSITADTLDDALKKIVSQVFKKGSILKDQRKITIREERSLSVVIKSPLKTIPSHYSRQYLEKYKDEFMKGTSQSDEFVYTYHDRIFKKWGNQPEKIISLMKKSPNTRRAMISLWDPKHDLGSQTPPCLNFMWFCVRQNRLECHLVYRSHHLATVDNKGNIIPGEGAFVPNLYAISHLHHHIAKQTSFETGPLILTDFSGHLYVCE